MRRNLMLGFTLIELMVTVVVIAILASIAFPSYQDYVMRSRRTDGKGFLLSTQQNVERAYTDMNSYASAVGFIGASGVTSPEGYYQVTVAASTTSTYTLNSAPQGAQASDKCGTFVITEAGAKSVIVPSGSTLTTADCWPR